jgi:hypothetical protein
MKSPPTLLHETLRSSSAYPCCTENDGERAAPGGGGDDRGAVGGGGDTAGINRLILRSLNGGAKDPSTHMTRTMLASWILRRL